MRAIGEKLAAACSEANSAPDLGLGSGAQATSCIRKVAAAACTCQLNWVSGSCCLLAHAATPLAAALSDTKRVTTRSEF